jgi:hypothetical protein
VVDEGISTDIDRVSRWRGGVVGSGDRDRGRSVLCVAFLVVGFGALEGSSVSCVSGVAFGVDGFG